MNAIVRPVRVPLLLLLAPASVAGVAVTKVAARTPNVMGVLVDGTTARVVLTCVGGRPRHLELDSSLTPYGRRPLGTRAVAQRSRKDGQASCVPDEDPKSERGVFRVRPIQLTAVTPSVVRDGKGARLIVSLDGQALGPKSSSADGVYLAGGGRLVHLDAACPEARDSDSRVVACIALEQAAALDRVRVRLQSAGRLAEAPGAPVDIAILVRR